MSISTKELRMLSNLRLSMGGEAMNLCIVNSDRLLQIADELDCLRKQAEAGRQAASAIRRHLEMYPKNGSENLTEALAHAREVGLLGSKS